ncbi:MAG: biotin carboxylase N-terminal domain-containing protein [Pseudomonadota bacterium]
MFDRILIANRGEIACRIIKTAQAMGVECVAVYSDPDRAARHVQQADRAVSLGGAAPAESYLRGAAIIEAALRTGAQAIHPGYGFLSENPEFAEAVAAAGLVFIGPSAAAIRAMGLKDAAKIVMEKAGVPVVPGHHGRAQGAAPLAKAADEIGFPVLIKPVAGGGGKGMRRVDDRAEFKEALTAARAEAEAAFGNPDVLVEKFVSHPRHIEIQIFGDGQRAVHLFERDCSLQRRHQKVIEEAPAPGMTEAVREAMGAAAVRAAEAIGYAGAGTVEFIADASEGVRADRFYFMEMNTRLQVEHPVTEAVTGIDLVEWQLRVAAGEPLPARQEDIRLSGHAFEARLYAEDVPAGFLPATGRLTHLVFPPDSRADTGVRAGDEISPHYDPMIAKLVTHGPTRAIALARLRRALARCEIAGSVTNLAFLGALAAHDGFAAGAVDTGLIERNIDALARQPPAEVRHWIAAGMALLGLQTPAEAAGFALWTPMVWRVAVTHRDEQRNLSVEMPDPQTQVWTIDGKAQTVIWRDGVWTLADRALPGVVVQLRRATVLDHYGLVFDGEDLLRRAVAADTQNGWIEAPMPGVVRALDTETGAVVRAGDRLAVLEAMKMEHALRAPRDGVVAEIMVAAGAQVAAGDVLVRLEEEA